MMIPEKILTQNVVSHIIFLWTDGAKLGISDSLGSTACDCQFLPGVPKVISISTLPEQKRYLKRMQDIDEISPFTIGLVYGELLS